MISTMVTIIPWCFLAAIKPCKINILKYSNISESSPPIISTNSGVSLKGDFSKPKFFGDVDKMNPKSICIKWPSLFSRMFPLCLKQEKKSLSDQSTTLVTRLVTYLFLITMLNSEKLLNIAFFEWLDKIHVIIIICKIRGN